MSAPAEPLGVDRVAAVDPERVAIVETDSGREDLTFAALLERVNRTSNALVERGLRPGDVVASIMPNRREYHELRLATEQVSLYFTPISHHLTTPEIAYILRDSGARLLVVDPSLTELVADAATEAGLAADDVVVLGDAYEEWVGAGAPTPPESPGAGDFMGYTSGTTGRPKAVRKPLTGRAPGVSPTRVGFMARLGIEAGRHVHLVGSPLYHAAPGTFSTVALQLGHTVVLSERPRPERLLELIDAHRVAYTFTVPTVLGRWLRLPAEERMRHDVSSLRSVVHAGAPCPPQVKRDAIAWLGPVINEFYGATEGSVTAVTAEEWLEHPGTVGLPIPGVDLKIFDDGGRDVPIGEVGFVYYRPTVPVEYHNDPVKTAQARHGDYITTGDMGHVDEDGRLYLADRRTDLILSGGVNIYPAEIESVLAASPDVADSAVVGIPDEDWGKRVVALVLPESTHQDPDAARSRIDALLRSNLAGFKVPREIRFVDELPRSETGKLLRTQIHARHVG